MRIELVAIPTGGRQAALARCVASYAGNAARYGRAPVFLVCDDAREAGVRADTCDALLGVAASTSVDIGILAIDLKRWRP